MASSTSSHSSSNSVPATASKTGRPSSVRISTVMAPQGPHRARAVVDEFGRRHREEAFTALLVGSRGAQDERPQRPRVLGQPVARRLGHDLELVHRGGALAVRRAEAVGAGVAAADDDDALAGRRDRRRRRGRPPGPGSRVSGSRARSAHRRAPRPGTGRSRGRVAPPARTTASNSACTSAAGRTRTSGAQAVPRPRSSPGSTPPPPDGLAASVGRATDRGRAHEGDAFGLQLGQPTVQHGLLHLELGDAVAQEAAGLLGALEHRHGVPARASCCAAARPAGPEPDDGHRLARVHARRLGRRPSPRPRPARRSRTRSARSSPGLR